MAIRRAVAAHEMLLENGAAGGKIIYESAEGTSLILDLRHKLSDQK